ncbi:nuclear mRNA export, poly(A)+RNA binding protein [Apophysomyces sp. BC1034]|nr:nuclear mRNA export, poly(A)+RNA binding protein [Apophysomyces sp. BC1015]KAG0171085.1 nuclear mRNA export, poly(A)+RNA binding protein [Apophysomyces sp. BC1021]KAG0184795.1 nuclear mRNA export, poly(A)+RNA binding protein [Apophysomyces sp. BC1034]
MTDPSKSAAPTKGMFAMFGGSAPKLTPAALMATAGPTNKQKAGEKGGGGGGAWKTAKRSKRTGLSLAAKSRASGASVSITGNTRPTAEIEDDDVDMSSGVGRFSPYGRKKKQKSWRQNVMETESDQRIDILIEGFQPGSETSLIPFLQKKTKKIWEPLDVKTEPGQILLTVAEPVVAHALTRLNGYIYGPAQLQIRLYSASTPDIVSMVERPKKATTIDTLRSFLRSRWNSEAKYLNLDEMASDPILKKAGIKPPGTSGATAVVGPAMMKLAGEMFEDIVTLSLKKNWMKNVQQISTITQFLPNLQNLSLEDNHIQNFEGIDALSGTGKLKYLRELVLLGNPLRESEIKQRGNDRGYIRNVVKRFPSLVMLDHGPVTLTLEEAVTIQKYGKVLPLDTKGNLFDTEDNQAVALDFLTRYFAAFDNNRSGLSMVYDGSAIFSVNAYLKLRKESKVRRKEKKKAMEDDDAAVSWTSISRNLAKTLKRPDAAGKGLMCGPEAIGGALARLPPTIHDLQKTEDFVVDAHQVPHGVMVTLHGEFKEDDNTPPYSFDRSFIICPSPEGSPANMAGWPYIIMSDMLSVRDYVGNEGFKPQAGNQFISIFSTCPSLPQPPEGV